MMQVINKDCFLSTNFMISTSKVSLRKDTKLDYAFNLSPGHVKDLILYNVIFGSLTIKKNIHHEESFFWARRMGIECSLMQGRM